MQSVESQLAVINQIISDHDAIIKNCRKNTHDLTNNVHDITTNISYQGKELAMLFDITRQLTKEIKEFHDKFQESIIKKNFIIDIFKFIWNNFYKVLIGASVIYLGASSNSLKDFLLALVNR